MATNLQIDKERLWSSLMETAKIGGTAKGGIRRLTLSDEDKEVRDWFKAACEAEGLTVAIDALGNMFATRPGTDPDAAPIAFGSHLDTQPAGGKFDGILGVLAGLEAIRTMNAAGYQTRAPITLINWTNEEGARFAPAMMCSGVFSGEIPMEQALATKDNDGRVFGEELERIGYRGPETVGARSFAAFVELHIEQGPILEAEEKTIGIVTDGQGILWFDGTIVGQDCHAGTTPMPMRRDALVALAEMILAIEAIALDHAPSGHATVGEVFALPGSRNTIPGTTHFKADFRHPDRDALTHMEEDLHARVAAIAQKRNVTIDIRRVWRKDPIAFDPMVVEAVAASAQKNGFSARRIISGAGHDAFFMASTCPTGMIFVPCAGGISHNEEESATEDDCGAGAQVLLDTILRLDEALSGA
ncbi:Zn-dependent hydrolase [Acuticoccus kandeliae]|uniref:Zn-dependent hydrolase n=1 Tax=Acuticoccus kandeliae TaxID=2073160 RepID=UPI000D3EB839|nr:Zn-dependent hydrolase [Acuticoccus kandeliae]